jgi:hypothetical protein
MKERAQPPLKQAAPKNKADCDSMAGNKATGIADRGG